MLQVLVIVYEVCKDPSDPWNWAGAGADLVFMLVPFATGGSFLVKGAKNANKFKDLEHAGDYGIGIYKKLKKLTKGKGLEVHHIIEKRFLPAFKNAYSKSDELLSVVLTHDEHKIFTKEWRKAFAYGKQNYGKLSRYKIWEVAQDIYKGYDELLDAAKRTLFG